MSRFLPALCLAALCASQAFAGSLGPGPWAAGAYYPGGTDGKYQANAYGNNITGVIGFALREGSPTVTSQTTSTTTADVAGTTIAAATSAINVFDETQNYFVIFVEGRTYSGLAVGSVNPVGGTVTGALLGAQPDFGFVTNNLPFKFPELTYITNTNVTIISSNPVITFTTNPGITVTNVTNTFTTNIVVTNVGGALQTNFFVSTNTISNVVTTDPIIFTNTNWTFVFQTNTVITDAGFSFSVSGGQGTTNVFDPLPVLNRGVSGGFQANLTDNGAYMTFQGDGELSAPSLSQTVILETNSNGTTTVGGITTETTPFKVDGLRVSFYNTSVQTNQ